MRKVDHIRYCERPVSSTLEDDSGTSNRAFTSSTRLSLGTESVDCTLQRESAYDSCWWRSASCGCGGTSSTGFSPAQLTRLGPARRDWRRGGPARAQQRATVRDAVRADRHSAAGRGRRRSARCRGSRRICAARSRCTGIRTAGGHFAFARLRAGRAPTAPSARPGRDQGVERAIAVRKAPEPNGVPGFRGSSVHQGDRDGVKGVYIVNLVDEVTQYEYIGVVRGISAVPDPGPGGAAAAFPFPGVGFPRRQRLYINHRVADLLQKLHVGEFTKSRARRSNDNWSPARTRTWCAGISATSTSPPGSRTT